MSTFVVYEVTVLVEVDEAGGAVVSVRVDDETVRGPVDVVDVAGSSLTDDHRQRLIEVADTSAWPAWRLGFV